MRDRSISVALGRPVAINDEDSDVDMITEADFLEHEIGQPEESAQDPVHVQFFIQNVKLSRIMGVVLAQQYLAVSTAMRRGTVDLMRSETALKDWLDHCPEELNWEPQRHHFWAALLHCNYFTTLCLLHRPHMSRKQIQHLNLGFSEEPVHPSKDAAHSSAQMITSIIEVLQMHDELKQMPAFTIYSLFSALVVHVYQLRSLDKKVVAQITDLIDVCTSALLEISRIWPVAETVYALFQTIVRDRRRTERLQTKIVDRATCNILKRASRTPFTVDHDGIVIPESPFASEASPSQSPRVPFIPNAQYQSPQASLIEPLQPADAQDTSTGRSRILTRNRDAPISTMNVGCRPDPGMMAAFHVPPPKEVVPPPGGVTNDQSLWLNFHVEGALSKGALNTTPTDISSVPLGDHSDIPGGASFFGGLNPLEDPCPVHPKCQPDGHIQDRGAFGSGTLQKFTEVDCNPQGSRALGSTERSWNDGNLDDVPISLNVEDW